MSRSGNWVRPTTRRAIYHRDSHTCAWCGRRGHPPGRTWEPPPPGAVSLTLDHLDPDRGDLASNVVTCCRSCNSSRRALDPVSFLVLRRGRTQEEAEALVEQVRRQARGRLVRHRRVVREEDVYARAWQEAWRQGFEWGWAQAHGVNPRTGEPMEPDAF